MFYYAVFTTLFDPYKPLSDMVTIVSRVELLDTLVYDPPNTTKYITTIHTYILYSEKYDSEKYDGIKSTVFSKYLPASSRY